jgi:hypothetical protein
MEAFNQAQTLSDVTMLKRLSAQGHQQASWAHQNTTRRTITASTIRTAGAEMGWRYGCAAHQHIT